MVCGTTGESPTVFYDQKIELFKAVIDAVGGRVPIIANAGDNCTDDSVEFAKEVQALGVNAIMAVVPVLQQAAAGGAVPPLQAIAEAVDLPVIVYNIPGRCVINCEPATVLRLANDCENIVAIKQANGDLSQTAAIIAEAPEGFEVFAGDDELTLPADGAWRHRRHLGHLARGRGALQGDDRGPGRRRSHEGTAHPSRIASAHEGPLHDG